MSAPAQRRQVAHLVVVRELRPGLRSGLRKDSGVDEQENILAVNYKCFWRICWTLCLQLGHRRKKQRRYAG